MIVMFSGNQIYPKRKSLQNPIILKIHLAFFVNRIFMIGCKTVFHMTTRIIFILLLSASLFRNPAEGQAGNSALPQLLYG